MTYAIRDRITKEVFEEFDTKEATEIAIENGDNPELMEVIVVGECKCS